MKRSAAAILAFMFVAIALLAARSNARSHPNGVLKTIEQGVTSLNDDDIDFIPCNQCGNICTASLPPLCVCEDVNLLCRLGCKHCEPVFELVVPVGFRCLDFAYYDCKNHHHWFAEPITTTPESIN